jgi:hypothetical protein
MSAPGAPWGHGNTTSPPRRGARDAVRLGLRPITRVAGPGSPLRGVLGCVAEAGRRHVQTRGLEAWRGQEGRQEAGQEGGVGVIVEGEATSGWVALSTLSPGETFEQQSGDTSVFITTGELDAEGRVLCVKLSSGALVRAGQGTQVRVRPYKAVSL